MYPREGRKSNPIIDFASLADRTVQLNTLTGYSCPSPFDALRPKAVDTG